MRFDVIRRVQKKELALFFASPVGYLFIAAFLGVTLFVFFWGEAFFARNVADVRPMFEWMPVLLVFLAAALTMRMWSEERRTGTMEFVVTMPVTGWEFVLGKFAACWILLGVALLLTLPLPITIGIIADLDWGPVVAGYVAAVLLGGAYICVGLFVSARTDSQIVSLIVTCFLCGVFYMLGAPVLTDLVGGGAADVLRSVGSGARFESITRGVLDFRDLYFYASVLLSFLALNVYALEVQRWAGRGDGAHHNRWKLGTTLVIGNLLVANLWLAPMSWLRVDMTEGRIYSISEATQGYLSQLREPLLIRGYFSDKTHPLLGPLVPRMKDLLTEFEVAGGGNVRVELIDPADAPELEDEANTKYGIRPVPFQVADRYQASLVNSYFDVLVAYGDEYEVLGFRDLIEVKVTGEADLDVQLRNPEYDLTRTIKKILYGFQGGNSVFANIQGGVAFNGYLSADDKLPEGLSEYKAVLRKVLDELREESSGRLEVSLVDPEAGDGSVALEIASSYGFQPMAASLFDTNYFYFYLTLTDGETVVQIPIPQALSQEATRRGIEEGLKRFATGLLKTVVLVAPPPVNPYMQQQGMPPGNQFNQLRDGLSQDFNVQSSDLANGVVPEAADVLIVVDPDGLDEKAVFAIDQFLMKGGTVALATGNFTASFMQQSLVARRRASGLGEWLEHHGYTLGDALVMDPVNSAFPVPVTRQAGGFSFQEIVMLDYPYFPDVRVQGLNQDSPITTGVPQVTVSWASPIEVDADKQGQRALTELISTSPRSWTSSSTDVMPRFADDGASAFVPQGVQQPRLVGLMSEGRFESFFKGQTSPLLTEEVEEVDEEESATEEEGAEDTEDEADDFGVISSVLEHSPESARLLLFSSNDFLADQTLRMVGSADGTLYTNSVQLLMNAVDFSLEDQSLLGIRARGNFNRTLPPMEAAEQQALEYLNYALALLGIAVVYLIYRQRRVASAAVYQNWIEGGAL
ncbi:MAG: Gldg family protein [Pseudomonadales bacterium]|jgi:ABC-2 type transport system permease protein|nr:Gldg family protein [Pseudomonadales bacterium]MDP6470331.1 Gldg family protein [Pseudomonadales bacterium]MDP6827237.1 Gldg family protein [Pseudomonadales bacterium]MDP6972460.1 Gldg family protein [Pseudomonadales bacterium]